MWACAENLTSRPLLPRESRYLHLRPAPPDWCLPSSTLIRPHSAPKRAARATLLQGALDHSSSVLNVLHGFSPHLKENSKSSCQRAGLHHPYPSPEITSFPSGFTSPAGRPPPTPCRASLLLFSHPRAHFWLCLPICL